MDGPQFEFIAHFCDAARMTYPGGKGRAYQRIISLMPPHATYVETHLGGGSVLRHKRPARRSIGIDIDVGVVERWRYAGMAGLKVVHGCAAAFLRGCAFSGDELVYCDPPYWPDAQRRRAATGTTTLFLFATTKSRKYDLRRGTEQTMEDVEVAEYIPDIFSSSYAQFLLNFETSTLIDAIG